MKKLVLHIQSGDLDSSAAALRMINKFCTQAESEPFSAVMLATGDAVTLFKKGSPLADSLRETMKRGDVSLEVCANALKRSGIFPDALLAGVRTVPSGVYELVRLQDAGFAYVKVC